MISPASAWGVRGPRTRLLLVLLVGAAIGLAQRAATPTDYRLFSAAGADLWGGSLHVFGNSAIQAGPLQLLLAGLFPVFSRATPGADVVALHVLGTALMSAWLVMLVRGLRREVGRPPSAQAELVITGLAMLWSWTGDVNALGHPAQIVVPGLWLMAGIAARRGRWVMAGLQLAVAAGFETWGLLGLPLLLLLPEWRDQTRAAGTACLATAAIWLPFVVAGPFRMGQLEWSAQAGPAGLLLRDQAFTSGMRLAQLAVAMLTGALVANRMRRSPHAVWLVPLVALLIRLWVDPTQFSYYWLAPLTLCLVALACASKHMPVVTAVLAALAFCQVVPFGGAAKNQMLLVSSALVLVSMRELATHRSGDHGSGYTLVPSPALAS